MAGKDLDKKWFDEQIGQKNVWKTILMALIEPSLLGEFLAIKTLLRSPVPEGNPGVARHAEGMFWTSEASLRAESCGRNKGEGPKAPIRGSPARELRSLELTSEPDLSGESRNYRTGAEHCLE